MFTTNDLYNKLIISVIITILYIIITIFVKLTTEIIDCKSPIKIKTKYIYKKKKVIIVRAILVFISSFVLIDIYSKSLKPPVIKTPKVTQKKYNLNDVSQKELEKNLTNNNDLISIF